MTLTTSTLDDGLTVVTEEMADAHSVTMGFWVGTGSVDETGDLWGASHFLEHLLFKGTDQRSARSIAEAVDAVGGDMNAFTTREYTAFYVRLVAEEAQLGMDILSDILWSPSFRPDELESERQVILEEILMHNDEPADLVHEVLAAALWPDHPLGREVLGEERTISAMTRDQIASFHHEHYRPGNMVFRRRRRITTRRHHQRARRPPARCHGRSDAGQDVAGPRAWRTRRGRAADRAGPCCGRHALHRSR